MRYTLMLAAAAVSVLAAGAVQAQDTHFRAMLKGSDEVPPNATAGTGEVSATLNPASKTFTYKVTYSGLTGPATAAHFHGPAGPGVNAPPIVVVKSLASPISGSAALTDGQAADLKAGKWYCNVHTQAHPPGEIRGQLQPAP